MIGNILKLFPEFVSSLWIAAFGYLLFTGSYAYYLNPKFSYLLIIGLILSTLLLIGGILSSRKKSEPMRIFTNALLLIVPLFYLITNDDSSLGSYAFETKQTGISSRPLGIPAKSKLPKEMTKGKYYKIPLNRLASPYKNYDGIYVETLGQIYRSAGQKYIAFFRFAISCCAADARPIGVILPINDLTKDLQKDDWAIIRGKYSMDSLQGKVVRQIVPDEVEKVDAPPANKRYVY